MEEYYEIANKKQAILLKITPTQIEILYLQYSEPPWTFIKLYLNFLVSGSVPILGFRFRPQA